jgi:hypothetical protein
MISNFELTLAYEIFVIPWMGGEGDKATKFNMHLWWQGGKGKSGFGAKATILRPAGTNNGGRARGHSHFSSNLRAIRFPLLDIDRLDCRVGKDFMTLLVAGKAEGMFFW